MSEIRNWLNQHGCSCRHCYVVDTVYAGTSKKLSKESMDEFNRAFGKEIILKEASYDKNGQCSEFEYECNHPLIDEFSHCLKIWLDDHDFPLLFFMVSENIFLYPYEKLSSAQINEFEKEFEVKCFKYSNGCNSTYFKYEFKSG